MKTRKINAYMKHSKLWQHSDYICRAAFTRSLRGSDFNYSELMNAFVWFTEGWRASDIVRLSDALSQVNSEQQRSEPVPHDLPLVHAAESISHSKTDTRFPPM